jgi:hypothetical protein
VADLGVIELPSIPPSANVRGIPRPDSSSSFRREAGLYTHSSSATPNLASMYSTIPLSLSLIW